MGRRSLVASLLAGAGAVAVLHSGLTFVFHGTGRVNAPGPSTLAGAQHAASADLLPGQWGRVGSRGVQMHADPEFAIFGVDAFTFASQYLVALVPAILIEVVVLLNPLPSPEERDYVAGSDNTIKVQRAFDFEAWEKQRKNPDRYWQTLGGLLSSSTMVARLQGPLLVLNVISATVLFYEKYLVPQGYVSLSLPALPFTISSFALGLLLVFRVNNANNRYVRARNLWGSMLNISRDLCQQSALWAKSKEDAREFCRWVPAFTTSLMCFLRDPRSHDIGEELTNLAAGPAETAKGTGAGLSKENVDDVVNRPAGMVPHHYVLFRMRSQMENFDVTEQQRLLMEADVTRLINDMGACENVFATPIPVGYTKHTARFLFLWLMLLPLALQSQLGLGTVFAEQLLAFALLGIEDIGISIEEPFSVLPLKRIAGKIALEAQVVRRKAEELDVQAFPQFATPAMAVAGAGGMAAVTGAVGGGSGSSTSGSSGQPPSTDSKDGSSDGEEDADYTKIAVFAASAVVAGALSMVNPSSLDTPIIQTSSASKKAPGTWDYQKSTKDWSESFPLCAGQEQTPIDLSQSAVSSTSTEKLSSLMAYTPLQDREIFNNGDKNVQVNGGFGSLKLPDGEYEVKQFHFHFPSEHTVNGKLAAGELHIVHQKKGSTGTNDLAVVGILLEEKPDDTPMTPELKFMQQLGFSEELPGSKTRTKVAEPLDLNSFADEYAGGFYHYSGSLTTPPCSEKVHWYVLQKPAPVTKKMVAAFQQRFPENNRPIQPLNSRKLVASTVSLPGEFPGAPAAAAPKAKPVSWDYKKGTRDWSDGFPLCAGQAQTPIDLSPSAVSSSSKENLVSLMSYKPLDGLEVFNNGGKNVQVNGGFGSLKLPDGEYEVKQFHFHFPSEHTVNGRLADGELHIVHQKKGSTGTNDLAVVGILLDETSSAMATPELKFMQQLGFGDELPGKRTKTKVAEPLDLNSFANEFAGRYYHYTGSLTTPPCSEKVHWYVFERPALVTKDMVDSFKQRFPENNRPVQPLNARALISNGVSVPGEF